MMRPENRIPVVLLLMRAAVFVVMLMWTIDKFVRPDHAALVYEHFYLIKGVGPTMFYMIGALELLILAGFLIGYKKQWTYGAVLVFHAISTLSSFRVSLSPFEDPNLLFFAAWPMLAACFALFYLRDLDTRYVVEKS
jgi:putative oxidoreductase